MVIPHTGITAEIINDYTSVPEAPHGIVGYSLSKACGSVAMAVNIGEYKKVFSVYLSYRASLMKLEFLNRQRILNRIDFDLGHIALKPCNFSPGQLPPIYVSLSVIIQKDRWIYSPYSFQCPTSSNGPCGYLDFATPFLPSGTQ